MDDNKTADLPDTESEIANTMEQQAVLPGSYLKEYREKRGFSIDFVASKLCLRQTVVQKMESNDFELDKVNTFIKGYLRSYAKLLDADSDYVVSLYEQLERATDKHNQGMQSFSRKTAKEQHNKRITYITFVIFGFILIAWLSMWLQKAKDDQIVEPSSTEPAIVEMQENTQDDTTEDLNIISPLLEDNAETLQDTTEQVTEELSPIVEEEITEEAVEPSATETENEVEITYTGECWTEIVDAKGKKVIFSGAKGKVLKRTLSGHKPYKVLLGAPNKAKVRFEGEEIDVKYRAGRVARFELE